MLKILLFCALLPVIFGEKFRFDNYTLYKVTPQTEEQNKVLLALQEHEDKFDFWTEPLSITGYVSILSTPAFRAYLENVLAANQIKYEITLPNIQEVIDKESVKKYSRVNAGSMAWDAYYDLDDIYAWLDDLARTYPSVATVVVGGVSHEGREIRGIKISHGAGKKNIFIESGIHAREWIAPATTNYIINELLASDNEETQAAARDFDWYIFPVTNPDGYVWSHTEFRLWRKNRRQYGTAFGVDLNRNWNDNNWLTNGGASSNPSSNTYAGPGPFSEEETRTLSEYIISVAGDMELYLSMHSSGQLLLLPFGNTTEPLANYHDAMNIGRRAMGALSVRYGTPYTTGNIAEAIYVATGTSVDWVKAHLNVPLVYCYELRDRGTYGHLLPPDQVLPSGQETMDSILDLIYQARRYGYMNSANGIQAMGLLIAFVFASLLMQ